MVPSAGITGRTFRTGRAHHLADVRVDGDYLEAIPGVVGEFCTPIEVGGRTVGALNVESLAPIDPATTTHVERCAELLGLRLAELPPDAGGVAVRRLAAVASSLVAVADPDRTAAAVVAAACELAGTDSGAVFLGPPSDVRLGAAAGPLESALASTTAADLAQLDRLLAPLTSCYSSGEATGLAFVGGDALRSAGARAVVALPLVARGARTGILVLAHSAPLALGPDTVEPLELLAIVAGSHLAAADDLVELRTRASRDALTGLRNHARFHESLRDLGEDDTVVVAMLDIDGFKAVNDRLGHLAGDELLQRTASALKAAARAGALLFRVGGGELAVLLVSNDVEVAAASLRAMVAAARPVLHPHDAGVSAGVAARQPSEPVLDALARADAALYRAKRAGGGVGLG
jgi:diguanylate cyclase (GGDEF)-like protein